MERKTVNAKTAAMETQLAADAEKYLGCKRYGYDLQDARLLDAIGSVGLTCLQRPAVPTQKRGAIAALFGRGGKQQEWCESHDLDAASPPVPPPILEKLVKIVKLVPQARAYIETWTTSDSYGGAKHEYPGICVAIKGSQTAYRVYEITRCEEPVSL